MRNGSNTFLLVMATCYITMNMMYLATTLLCLPNYFSFSISSVPPEQMSVDCVELNNENITQFWTIVSSNVINNWDILTTAFLLSATMFFIVPCCILFAAFSYLFHKLSHFNHRRKRLSARNIQGVVRTNRQTIVLLVILALFVATQLPQGILTLLCSVLSDDYRHSVYQSLGDFMELLSVTNGLVSFICHCAMSSKFRNAFRRLILRSCDRRTQ